MPDYRSDGTSGSGFSPKNRLDLGWLAEGDTPVTKSELKTILKRIIDWSERLQFGREGFTTKRNTFTEFAPSLPETIVTFSQMIEDSNGFAKTQMPTDLQYFQVPPGLGRPYTINYYFRFVHLTEVVATFNYTGAMQEWTAPSNLFENTVTFRAKGAQGGNDTGGIITGGLGADVTATFTITPSSVFDIEVGQQPTGTAPGWPNGGLGDSQATGFGAGGGGRSSVRPDAAPLANALVVAGAGGGAGRNGPSSDPFGGNAGLPSPAADGQGNTVDSTLQAKGATSTAGGNGASFGTGNAGGNGSFGQGGAAGNTTNNFAFAGGGGGDGWYGGGGGAFAPSAGFYGGGGGGGSSYVRSDGTSVSYVAGAAGSGVVTATYYTESPVADTAIETKVWVAYAQFPNRNAYEEVRCVLSDRGGSPHSGSIVLPLGEGDRVWMTVSNAALTEVTVVDFTFGMYANGQ